MNVNAWACPECGAPSGDGCDDQCPSALALLDAELEATLAEPECHPDAASAAADWCYCQGTAGRAVA